MPTPFNQKQQVEAQGDRYLLPLMNRWFLKVTRVADAIGAQKLFGDYACLTQEGALLTVECKVEERTTGNLYIESWSNYTRGVLGWGRTCQADELWYYFLDTGELYILQWKPFQEWLFNRETLKTYRIPELLQGKTKQCNDTYGYLVSVQIIGKAIPDVMRAYLWNGNEFVEAELAA